MGYASGELKRRAGMRTYPISHSLAHSLTPFSCIHTHPHTILGMFAVADPFRTVDLSGYLKVAPFVGGAGYLAALFVQQTLPELFVFAYPLAVFVFAAPIAFIVLAT